MEETTDLLFVLSSPNRLALLSELKTEDLRLTQLAHRLSATVQETSKHLARLNDAKLIEKISNGSYRLTGFGRLSLELLPSFRFLCRNREYFLTHDISFLPTEFIQRVGELSEHEPIDHVGGVVSYTAQVMREAGQYFWLMADQCIHDTHDEAFLESILLRNISFRNIFSSTVKQETHQYYDSKLGPKLEFKEMDDVRVAIVMNEQIAGVCFPDLNGRIDFSRGFKSSSDSFRKWCRDLFNHYWDKAKRILPSQLQRETTVSPFA